MYRLRRGLCLSVVCAILCCLIVTPIGAVSAATTGVNVGSARFYRSGSANTADWTTNCYLYYTANTSTELTISSMVQVITNSGDYSVQSTEFVAADAKESNYLANYPTMPDNGIQKNKTARIEANWASACYASGKSNTYKKNSNAYTKMFSSHADVWSAGVDVFWYSTYYDSQPYPSNRMATSTATNSSYQEKQAQEDVVTIYADYECYGENFEIIKDLCVAVDADFNHTLELEGCSYNGSLYEYTFRAPKGTEKVYVAAPVVYVPAPLNSTTVNLSASDSSAMKQNIENPWFTVEEISMSEVYYEDATTQTPASVKNSEETSSCMPAVCVKVSGDNDTMIPRLPVLNINGQEYGGISTVIFDDNMNFESGSFTFILPTNYENASASTFNTSNISISDALMKADNATPLFQGDGVEITIVSK